MIADYIKERNPYKEVMKSDKGFCVYYINEPEDAVYIEDIFIIPEYRDGGEASLFLQSVINLYKGKVKYVLGSVDITTKGKDKSMKYLLNKGFSLYATQGNIIFVRMEIK